MSPMKFIVNRFTTKSHSSFFSQDFSTSVTKSDPWQSYEHWYKHWNALRRDKLTASTFGKAIGFWPEPHDRRVQLWQEKLGVIEPFYGNKATRWNNDHEKEAFRRYMKETKNLIAAPEFQIYVKPEDDWLAASPDAFIVEDYKGSLSGGVLEIKCPYFQGIKERSYPPSQIPFYCIPQAQGLLEISDREWMDFYVWTLNGTSLFRMYRNREYWDLLKVALSDFWWNHVQPGKEMCSKYKITDPLIQMSSLTPAPKHKDCGLIEYASKYLAHKSELLAKYRRIQKR